MTIDEAIAHAREVAEGCPAEDRQCAYQHDKLADWLEELKAYQETELTPEEIITLKSIKNWADAVEREYLKFVELEKDRRLITLPCRVGDTVFAAETSPVIPLSVMCVGVYLEGADGGDWESLENFGKTVFLTRDAAEVARKEQGG